MEKNKAFIFTSLLILVIVAAIALTGQGIVSFIFYFVQENASYQLVYLVILDVVLFISAAGLMRSIFGFLEGKGSYSHVNIMKNWKNLVFAILIILGFNLLGFVQAIEFNIAHFESILSVTFIGFIITILVSLVFTILLVIKKPEE
jgi:hypothetical protein